jgi:hypothetical protein
MYPVSASSADLLGLIEIESGTARKVAAQASNGNMPPNTTRTMIAPAGSKLFVRRSIAKAQA